MASNVKIHRPDGIHDWGIEYNFSRESSLNAPASAFVQACRKLLFSQRPCQWFYQCGSDTPDKGYQFFEFFGPDPENVVPLAAQEIAQAIGCAVET